MAFGAQGGPRPERWPSTGVETVADANLADANLADLNLADANLGDTHPRRSAVLTGSGRDWLTT